MAFDRYMVELGLAFAARTIDRPAGSVGNT